MKKLISDTLNELFIENILDDQVKWEYFKYNIRKCTINFSKKLAKNTKKIILETKLKHFVKHFENYVDNIDYKVYKQQLDEIHEKKLKGKKFNIFFLNLEKHRAIQSQIHSVIISQDENRDKAEINKQIFSFYQSLFSRKVKNQTDKTEAYLEKLPLPKLTNEQTLSCEGIISEEEVFKSLKFVENNKSFGNGGLSKEFYECFWDEIKKPFLASIQRPFLDQELRRS